MKLSDWASIAEITSSVAVLLTLILLTLGIRENTQITRAAVYAEFTDGINRVSSDMYRDSELTRIWIAFNQQSTESLGEAEKGRLVPIVFSLLREYEKAFIGWRYNVIGAAEWSRFERGICTQYGHIQAFIRSNDLELRLDNAITDEFRDYLTASCNK